MDELQLLVGILAILVTVIAIAIPLMIYYLQIKPAQKVLEKVSNVEKMVNDKVLAIIEAKEEQRITEAIDQLSSSVGELSSRAFQILNLNLDYDFSEIQLFKIYSYLKTNTSNHHKFILSSILASKRTPFGDEFFESEIQSKDHSGVLMHSILTYYSNYSFVDNLHLFRSYILNTSNSEMVTKPDKIAVYYNQVAGALINISSDSLLILLNDNELNIGLDKEIRTAVYNFLKIYPIFKTNKIDLSQTKLAVGLSQR